MLLLHDIRLIDENPEEGRHQLTASIPLKAGWHPLCLLYRIKAGRPDFKLRVITPDGTELPINRTTAGHLPQE